MMTKMEFRRRKKVVRDDIEGESSRGNMAGLVEESSSGSSSSKDRLKDRSSARGRKILLVGVVQNGWMEGIERVLCWRGVWVSTPYGTDARLS